jgi:hypothetical protein
MRGLALVSGQGATICCKRGRLYRPPHGRLADPDNPAVRRCRLAK